MIITTTKNAPWCQGNELNTTASFSVTLGAEKQTVRGFGGCFNELGDAALRTLPPKEQEKIMSDLFSQEGCSFNYCRIPIGANDFALNWYSLNETDGDYEMKHFTLDRDRQHIIPYIKSAMEQNPDITFFASPWSPPSWLKTPKVYNHGEITKTPEVYKAYALYFKKFVEEYKKEGIPVKQVLVQNEPSYLPKYPCCEWKGETIREFVADYLSKELYGVADIFLGTHTGAEKDKPEFLPSYTDYVGYILQDEKCKAAVKGIGYQWAGKSSVQMTNDDYPDLEIIQTESECGDSKNTWEYAMYIFSLMRHYFRNGVSSYIYWNMILGEGVSTWGWEQNCMITIKDGTVTYNPEFYVMKHIAHFVKAGAKYMETKGNWSSNSIAFKNPDSKVVIVCANPYQKDIDVSFEGKTYCLPAQSFNTIIL